MLQFFGIGMRRIIGIFIIAAVLLVNGVVVFGQLEGELRIVANYKDQTQERIYATGNVEIYYKNLKLFADKIELDLETKDVYAEGNVVIQLPNEAVSADSIRLNLDSKTMTARVLQVPAREDIETMLNEQLIVEYYSR